MKRRFTIDGSEALENRLQSLCERIATEVNAVVPSSKLEALVLGGGYGRGEGGVLRSADGDKPYNDLEFYVFMRGNRLLKDRRYAPALCKLADSLSPEAGLHVEFKIDSFTRLCRSNVSMFSYDLVSGHRIVTGPGDLFAPCTRHQNGSAIPLSEATRLLFNRCTGLLLVREMLRAPVLNSNDCDFVGRNLAKAKLALGDAVLTVFGSYHWSCRERRTRLGALAANQETGSWLPEVQHQHALGVEFKLHPQRQTGSREEFHAQLDEVSKLSLAVWLWLEARRLNRSFPTPHEYALSSERKCPEQSWWRNYLLNLKFFGAPAALDARARLYPRERLLNSLPLLLWNGEVSREEGVRRHLQQQLRSRASDWSGLVAAYKQIWAAYG